GTATRIVVALAALVSLSGLTACDSKVGAAAYIDGERISEQQLNTYVLPGAKPFQNQQGRTLYPKTYVLQQLIQGRVADRIIADHGGTMTAAEARAARAQVLGSNTEDQIIEQVAASGFSAKAEGVLVDTATRLVVLQKRFPAVADASQLLAAVQKADVRVSVSPRYGKWDPSTLSVTNGPARGNFMTGTNVAVASTPAAPAQ
ncbi:MAG: hypothetical protein ABJA87_11990, partial [bacterium]